MSLKINRELEKIKLLSVQEEKIKIDEKNYDQMKEYEKKRARFVTGDLLENSISHTHTRKKREKVHAKESNKSGKKMREIYKDMDERLVESDLKLIYTIE